MSLTNSNDGLIETSLGISKYLKPLLLTFPIYQNCLPVGVLFPKSKYRWDYTGLEVIAGLLYVPLSDGGKDFIAFLRRGQKHDVHWAGKPYKDSETEQRSVLEPRKSFKAWSETVVGRSRAWTAEQLETAGVLALVYGKVRPNSLRVFDVNVLTRFESSSRCGGTRKMLLRRSWQASCYQMRIMRVRAVLKGEALCNQTISSNATEPYYQVCTWWYPPLKNANSHQWSYLEMALNGALDEETRNNLTQTYTASKVSKQTAMVSVLKIPSYRVSYSPLTTF